MAEQIRLQKYISDCGLMSRRASELEIASGNVSVNGITAVIGQKITAGVDIVTFKGREVRADNEKKRYIMLNKPVGYLTSMSDDRGRKCVPELLEKVDARVYPCGRLDLDSEGLLILTNDGEFANRLTHPGHGLAKYYHVRVSKTVTPDDLKALCQPMEIDGYKIQPVRVSLVSLKQDYSVLCFELYEGRNRQIRKMCEQVGLRVTRLKRVAIGNVMLDDLKPGEWKELTGPQVRYLMGSKPNKQSPIKK